MIGCRIARLRGGWAGAGNRTVARIKLAGGSFRAVADGYKGFSAAAVSAHVNP